MQPPGANAFFAPVQLGSGRTWLVLTVHERATISVNLAVQVT